MNILLYNPNSDVSLTQRLGGLVGAALTAGDKLASMTATAAPLFIGSDETIDAARYQLAQAVPTFQADIDAVLLGCFGDLAIEQIRRSVRFPILSLSDVCFAVAPSLQRRVAIVTTTAFWAARLSEEIERRDLSSTIVGVHACLDHPVAFHGDLIASCRAAVEQIAASEAAETVVMGGALLSVVAPELSESPIPIVDLFGAAVETCRASVGAG